MNCEAPVKTQYTREHVAVVVEGIIALRGHTLTPEDRVRWESYPAQARAHRYPSIHMDQNHPISEYFASGAIGPFRARNPQ